MTGIVLVLSTSLLYFFRSKPKFPLKNYSYPLRRTCWPTFYLGITEPVLSSKSAELITTTHAGGVSLWEHDKYRNPSLTVQIQALPHTLPLSLLLIGKVDLLGG